MIARRWVVLRPAELPFIGRLSMCILSGHHSNELNRSNVAVRRIAAAAYLEELATVRAKCILIQRR
jgi:hypothetical protein